MELIENRINCIRSSVQTCFISTAMLQAGSQWQQPSKAPRRPSPQQHFPAPPGGPRGVPRPDEIYNPSSVFWVCPGASYQWDVPRTPLTGGAQEDPDQMLNHLNMKEQRLYSELPPDV